MAASNQLFTRTSDSSGLVSRPSAILLRNRLCLTSPAHEPPDRGSLVGRSQPPLGSTSMSRYGARPRAGGWQGWSASCLAVEAADSI